MRSCVVPDKYLIKLYGICEPSALFEKLPHEVAPARVNPSVRQFEKLQLISTQSHLNRHSCTFQVDLFAAPSDIVLSDSLRKQHTDSKRHSSDGGRGMLHGRVS